jgi:hypothetical protein
VIFKGLGGSPRRLVEEGGPLVCFLLVVEECFGVGGVGFKGLCA